MSEITHGEKSRIIADIYLQHKKLWPETEDAEIVKHAVQIAQDIFDRAAELSKLEMLALFEKRQNAVCAVAENLRRFIEIERGALFYDKNAIADLIGESEQNLYYMTAGE